MNKDIIIKITSELLQESNMNKEPIDVVALVKQIGFTVGKRGYSIFTGKKIEVPEKIVIHRIKENNYT